MSISNLLEQDTLNKDWAKTFVKEANCLKLTVNNVVYPLQDGTFGDAIVTDGDGNLRFATVSGGGGQASSIIYDDGNVSPPSIGSNVQDALDSVKQDFLLINGSNKMTGDLDLDSNSIKNVNSLKTGSLIAAGLNYPISDGVAGSVIKTDGLGNLNFSSSGSVPASAVTYDDMLVNPPSLNASTDVQSALDACKQNFLLVSGQNSMLGTLNMGSQNINTANAISANTITLNNATDNPKVTVTGTGQNYIDIVGTNGGSQQSAILYRNSASDMAWMAGLHGGSTPPAKFRWAYNSGFGGSGSVLDLTTSGTLKKGEGVNNTEPDLGTSSARWRNGYIDNVTSANTNTNNLTSTNLNVGVLTYPNTDAVAGSVLTTNGLGNLSLQPLSSPVSPINIYGSVYFGGYTPLFPYNSTWPVSSSFSNCFVVAQNATSARYVNGGMVATSTGLIVPSSGVYSATAHITCVPSAASTQMQVCLANGANGNTANVQPFMPKSGNFSVVANGNKLSLSVTGYLLCNANDFIQLWGQSATAMTATVYEWTISAFKIN